MANWIDFFSLIATVVVFGGVIYGVILVVKAINSGVSSTKKSLKSRGLDVSATGVSVKTTKRLDREGYIDATQRGIVKAVNASSFRNKDNGTVVAPAMSREQSNSSSGSEEKKKKHMFGSRK